MTALQPVPVTPADRFEQALQSAGESLTAGQRRAIRLAAGEWVAAEAQAIARTPRSQTDPMHRRESGDVA